MIRKLNNNRIRTPLLACLMLCAFAGVAFAGGTKDRSADTVVGEYSIQAITANQKLIKDMTLGITFEAGRYYLKPQSKGSPYTQYLIGCQDVAGVWYLWKNNSWTQMTTADAPLIAVLSTIQSNVRTIASQQTITKKLTGKDNLRSFSYEVSISEVAFGVGVAARSVSLVNMNNGKIDVALSDGSVISTTPAGISGDIVVGLYSGNGTANGDGLVFKRPAGMFSGEAALFHRSAYQAISYQKKALALLYEFFNAKGEGDNFKSMVNRLYVGVMQDADWSLFSLVSQVEKDTILSNMATVLGIGLSENYRETQNEKSVFGNPRNTRVSRSLYGDLRNVYFDAYLAFCLEKNQPVFAGYVRSENSATVYDPDMYTKLNATEGKELADAAMRFYTWGVEYTSDLTAEKVPLYKGSPVYPEIKNVWFTVNNKRVNNYWPNVPSTIIDMPKALAVTGTTTITLPVGVFNKAVYATPFTAGKSGYPLPYAKNGIDSPRTFAWKMHSSLQARLSSAGLGKVKDNTTEAVTTSVFGRESVNAKNYQKTSFDGKKFFQPGGNSGKLNEAGIDAFGFVTGSIAMTSFYSGLVDRNGKKPAQTLDGYYSMQSAGIARDSDGKPSYSDTALHPTDWTSYRLVASDLEKCSVVVSDLSQIQLGDLVVRFAGDKGGKGTEIGIVVGLPLSASWPQYGSNQFAFNQKDFRDQIVVLSVREGFRQVTLGRWGNPAGMFGGFTDEPDLFHVRRLVKKTTSDAESFYTANGWDVCEILPARFDITVNGMREQERKGDDTIKERWIPNTGEYLLLTDARLFAKNDAGSILDLTGISPSEMEVFVSGAVDRGYDAAKPAGVAGNIYINSPCKFEVALVKGNSIQKLGVLENGGGGLVYTMKYEGSALYNATDNVGTNKNSANAKTFAGNRIWLDSIGRIQGVINGDAGYVLGIRPESGNSARAGDDLQLQFSLRKRGSVAPMTTVTKDSTGVSKTISVSATMKEADYVAVYDKKMLWRANLYIAEIKNDWNDVHPWVTGNEWNIDESGNVVTGVKAGKQVLSIKSWTRPYKGTGTNFRNTNRDVFGNVAYSLGGADSPFGFNAKLNNQMNALNQISPNPGWTVTTAPKTSNYSDWSKYATKSTLGWNDPNYPWIPNYSTYMKYGNDPSTFIREDALVSAGLDCNGFLQRVKSYNNNPYEISSMTNLYEPWNTWTGSASTLKESVGDIRTKYSQLISLNTDDWQIQPENLEYAVPGDFILINENGHSHVAIIQGISSPEGGNKLTRKNFTVIHSTMGKDWSWMVRNEDVWQTDKINYFGGYSDIWYSDGYSFELRRLK